MQGENTEILNAFAFRLNARAGALGLSQADIAQKLGAKAPRVNNWFQGKNFPRSRERVELVRILRCTSDWLFNGEGDPEPASEVPLQEDSRILKIAVRAVPLISWVHAGAAASYDELPKHWHGSVSSMSRDKRAFALTIEGDSMEPKFLSGDRVVCEPTNPPHNGRPVVVKYSDDAVQLRIYHKLPNGKIRLAPINPVYPTIEHKPSDFDWIWPVCELSRAV